MPPDYAAMRVLSEFRKRRREPIGFWEQRTNQRSLLKCLESPDIASLHKRVLGRPHPAKSHLITPLLLDRLVAGESGRIVRAADAAAAGRVEILGSGMINLQRIDWHRDYKSGMSWPMAHFTELDPADLDRPSDVKFPWELSRLQWLIPVAQAWCLTQDDRYAARVRDLLDDWMDANPYGWGINWASAMEAAMRVFTWTWFYRTMGNSPSWQGPHFRARVLSTIYLHLHFVRRHLELSDINGNHLIANAAALVAGGGFFGAGRPRRWMKLGERILNREILLQVLPDGVDYEGSIPYHRLVAECLYFAAAAVDEDGGSFPPAYHDRLLKMADYIRAYTKPDGLAPVFGDADDARVLPFGGQPINDHRYLPHLIRGRWAKNEVSDDWEASASECLWWWGAAPQTVAAKLPPESTAFPNGGSFILRSHEDYVFVDCGPIGLSGRGGHGHNDCLAFEAALKGVSLIVDPGSYTYTGDYRLRNKFRSTRVHNTPLVDEEEINRFVSERTLWFMQSDAQPKLLAWEDDDLWTLFRGSHTGYERLSPAARVVRTVVLHKNAHAFAWSDMLESPVPRQMQVSLQLAENVHVNTMSPNAMQLQVGMGRFILEWQNDKEWSAEIELGAVAPSYGVWRDAHRLTWRPRTRSATGLTICVYEASVPDDARRDLLLRRLMRHGPWQPQREA